jgi:hypothetical protein
MHLKTTSNLRVSPPRISMASAQSAVNARWQCERGERGERGVPAAFQQFTAAAAAAHSM